MYSTRISKFSHKQLILSYKNQSGIQKLDDLLVSIDIACKINIFYDKCMNGIILYRCWNFTKHPPPFFF